MRDEEFFTPSMEDETVDHSFDALRLRFKELYDEIDFLGEQATLTVQSVTHGSDRESEVLRKADVEDLIVYARKFVRETRKTIVTFDEHGVQCEPAKRSNKKVSTPKGWLQPKPEQSPVRNEMWECPFKDQSAVTVTQDMPRIVSSVLADQVEQLNNKVTVATAPEVRSIGTNVNFVSQRTVAKRTNVQRVVQPSTARSAKCASAGELRPRPVIKPRAPPSTAPVPTSSKQGKPPGRTFSDGQFKLLFDRFIQMQSEKHATEPSEKVSEDAEKVVTAQQVQRETILSELNVESALSNGSKDSGSNIEETDKECNKPIEGLLSEDKTSDPVDAAVESLGFTSHVLPGVSIKGRWDANLKVQQTGHIAILDEKDETRDEPSNNNVLYVELKRGHRRNVEENVPHEKLPIATDGTKKDVALESSELCVEDQDIKISSHVESSDSDCKATSYQESKSSELLQIRVPRSARNVIRHTNKPNKYLDPFVNMNRPKAPSKKNAEILFDIFDDDSSSTNTDDDLEEDDIRMLLNLKKNGKQEVVQTSDPESPKTAHVKALPTNVQCRRSLLEVSSIPAIHSPPSSRGNESSESERETASNGHSSRHFLKNLRIWKSALEVQSQNMKITNELTENLDVLKGNIEKIALESSKVAKMAQSVENNGADVEDFPRQRAPVRPESSTVRSRSCECFGCQSTFEEIALRPMTSPPYGHKQFQRAILEHNPRYAKTIRKIYQLGSSERPPSSAGADRDETVKKAAQKFLLSLQGNVNRRNCYSSGSSYGLVNSPSNTMSSGSDDTGEDSTLVVSGIEYCSDQDAASVSFSTSVDFKSDVSSLGQIVSSEGTDLSSFTINVHSQSDMGEVLSPGEIK